MPVPSQPKTFIPRPFAEAGTYQNVPDAPAASGRASFAQGFPLETQLPMSQGGLAPNRLDFNGMFNILSSVAFWQQSGGQWSYNASLNYAVPAFVYHNNILWWCVKENGPDSPNKAVAPGTNEAYWVEFLAALAGMGETKVGGANPVGTVITFYGTNAPEGYFACNGGSFSATQYPLLRAVLGSTILPDLRGYFVRGYDTRNTVDPHGQSRAVGSRQSDAGRNATGTLQCPDDAHFLVDGVFGLVRTAGTGTGGTSPEWAVDMDLSRAWGTEHTSTEFRPANIALLYCIKHD